MALTLNFPMPKGTPVSLFRQDAARQEGRKPAQGRYCAPTRDQRDQPIPSGGCAIVRRWRFRQKMNLQGRPVLVAPGDFCPSLQRRRRPAQGEDQNAMAALNQKRAPTAEFPVVLAIKSGILRRFDPKYTEDIFSNGSRQMRRQQRWAGGEIRSGEQSARPWGQRIVGQGRRIRGINACRPGKGVI